MARLHPDEVIADIEANDGIALDDELLRQLVDFEILTDADAAGA